MRPCANTWGEPRGHVAAPLLAGQRRREGFGADFPLLRECSPLLNDRWDASGMKSMYFLVSDLRRGATPSKLGRVENGGWGILGRGQDLTRQRRCILPAK